MNTPGCPAILVYISPVVTSFYMNTPGCPAILVFLFFGLEQQLCKLRDEKNIASCAVNIKCVETLSTLRVVKPNSEYDLAGRVALASPIIFSNLFKSTTLFQRVAMVKLLTFYLHFGRF